jgi:hypothetical protein
MSDAKESIPVEIVRLFYDLFRFGLLSMLMRFQIRGYTFVRAHTMYPNDQDGTINLSSN